MKQRKKVLTYISLSIAVIFFILPAIGFSIINWGVLPPKKLTPLVIEQTNKFINANLDCERIELTYFETYPYLGVKLTNGRLISHIADDSTKLKNNLMVPADSLLSFKQLIIAVQPLDFLFKKKITVKDFTLDHPRIYGYVNKEGINNWTIYDDKKDSTKNDSSNSPLPLIDLQKVRIKDGHFTLDDRQSDVFTEINGFYLNIDGSLTTEHNTIDLEAGSTSTRFRSAAYSLENNLIVNLKSRIRLDNHYQSFTLSDAELKLNEFPFKANGYLRSNPATGSADVNIDMSLEVNNLNDIFQFIPSSYFKDKDKSIAKGNIILTGSVNGVFDKTQFPSVNLCCKIENGSYHQKDVKHGIDELQMDLDLHLNGRDPDSSFFSLQQLKVAGLNTSLVMTGKIDRLLTNPEITTRMKGKMDFTALGKEFFNPDTLLVEGELDADINASFKIDDLIKSRFGKIKAGGSLNIDRLIVQSDPLEMDLFFKNTRFQIDSSRYENKHIENKDLMRMTLTSDTMNLRYKDEVFTKVNKLHIQAQTTPVIDTSAVIPMSAEIGFNHLSTLMTDSVWVIAGRTSLKGIVKPSATDKHLPVAGAQITIDTLTYFSSPMKSGIVMLDNVIRVEALPYKEVRKQRALTRTSGADSTGRRRMTAVNRFSEDSASVSQKLLHAWEARGSMSFKRMNGYSGYFPLDMWMEGTTLKFNTNNITLSNANLHLGKSNFVLDGELKKLRQAFLNNGKMNGKFLLTSDYIDCNELMQAITLGMMLSDSQQGDSISSPSLSELEKADLHTAAVSQSLDTASALFVIPKFLDLSLDMAAKKIDFKDLEMTDVKGEVVVRDQTLNLNRLNMHSNMGNGQLTMVYSAKNKNTASTGFDLDMQQVQVDRIIDLFPSIDTLVPMLRSFEGVLNCQMSATCKLDSAMDIMIPSLNAACFMQGQDMVLLDGETFTEISKTLMFKNKKRNVIDSISVDIAVKDNKIEVFPFQAEIDRYRVAVGGTHNLDMTFNYHISVLKSPVPFKLGIDITGNMDKFKFKITKCKYKDLFKPAKMAELDSTRTNIKKDIRDAVRNQIKQTAPELSFND